MNRYDEVVAMWQKFRITTTLSLAQYLDSHGVLFAYNSNKIENEQTTYHDTREIFDKGKVVNYTGDLRTLFEIQNQKTAYEYIVKAFQRKEPITEGLVKHVHKLLTQGTYDDYRHRQKERPGEYKKHDYVTGANEVGALPEDVSEEMNELLEDIRGVDNEKALVAAAYFHAKFENIHPFADGNGRCGRTLMNYFLISHNHPPITVYEEDRNQYFKALEAFDTEQDLKPLTVFLKDQCSKTWEKKLERTTRHK